MLTVPSDPEPAPTTLDVFLEMRAERERFAERRLIRAEVRQLRQLLSQALTENLLLRGALNAMFPPEEMTD